MSFRREIQLAIGLFVTLGLLCCKTPGSGMSGILDEGTYPETRRSLQNYTCPGNGQVKVIFFDADSTLRTSKSGSLYPTKASDVYILPGIAPKIIEKINAGYLVAIASNQGNVPRTIAFSAAEAALVTTAQKLASLGATFHYLDFYTQCDDSNRDHERCSGSSGPDGEDFKKPNLGMARQLEMAIAAQCPGATIDKSESWYIGDAGYERGETHPDGRPGDDHSNSDRGFAENYGIQFAEPTDFFGWKDFNIFNFGRPYEVIGFTESLRAEIADVKARGEGEFPERLQHLEQMVAQLDQVNQAPPHYTYLHYNIKELETSHITGRLAKKAKAAFQTVSYFQPDLLSINELQYDKGDEPGQNMSHVLRGIGADPSQWQITFGEALTGRDVGKEPIGEVINFGKFPGQYSTGFATKVGASTAPVVFPGVPADINAPLPDPILWSEWDSTVDFTQFQLMKEGDDGEPQFEPYPEGVQWTLFDKNFNHTPVVLAGETIHFVNFHTVPAFNFGNDRGPNLQRNAAQLEFLVWFLDGTCDPADETSKIRRCETAIRPLRSLGNSRSLPLFIVVGDLNVDLDDEKPGAAVLSRFIYQSGRVYSYRPYLLDPALDFTTPRSSVHITYLRSGTDPRALKTQLDYFLVSKKLCVDSYFPYAPKSHYVAGECVAIGAEDRDQLLARATAALQSQYPQLVVGKSYDEENRQYCAYAVSKTFDKFRDGSDHLPVVLKFHLRNDDNRCD